MFIDLILSQAFHNRKPAIVANGIAYYVHTAANRADGSRGTQQDRIRKTMVLADPISHLDPKINAIVRKIKDSGAIGSDFIILSRYTLANPLNGLGLTGLDKDLGTLKTTGPLWKAKKNDVRFSTISGFKGLESKIVIMIDVDHFSNEDTRLLNYVAASRACAMLYVLYDSNAEQERQNMILSGFTKVGT